MMLMGMEEQSMVKNVSFKCYSTEDNLSSLNDITKQFSQSDGTATVSFVVPASWLIPALTPVPVVSSSSSKHFVTTRACVYIYFGCTVQWRSKLCKKKNIFKSVQYLNKEYSIYYPAVLDEFDIDSNMQLALYQNTIWYMSIKQYLAEALFF